MTEKMLSQLQAAEVGFCERVHCYNTPQQSAICGNS